jgi:molecular chaperone GrpE
MTTSRRIPINGRPDAAEGASAAAGTGKGAADPAPVAVTGATTASPGRSPTASPAQPAGQQEQAAETQLQAEVEALRQERDVLADRELRLRAEFENFRKRVSRQLTEERERAQAQLLHDLLPVLDNLARALDAAEHHDESKVLGGVRMTRDMFVELLKRAGVEEIETVGAQFDPQIHDAIVLQPSDQEEGTVTAVLERGYRQGDRVLRPARVAVSAGRPGPAAGAE